MKNFISKFSYRCGTIVSVYPQYMKSGLLWGLLWEQFDNGSTFKYFHLSIEYQWSHCKSERL